jgi:hypothetical protein
MTKHLMQSLEVFPIPIAYGIPNMAAMGLNKLAYSYSGLSTLKLSLGMDAALIFPGRLAAPCIKVQPVRPISLPHPS